MLLRFAFVLSFIGVVLCSNLTLPEANLRLDRSKTQVCDGVPTAKINKHHEDALKEANTQLQCMINAAYWATTKSHPGDKGGKMHKKYLSMIHDVFGKEANVELINKRVQTLATTTVVVAEDNIPNEKYPKAKGTYATVYDVTRELYLFSDYHAEKNGGQPMTKVSRARVLIHEASHAYEKWTYDWWSAKVQNGKMRSMPVNTPALNLHWAAKEKLDRGEKLTPEEKSHILNPLTSGYWHDGYETLREYMSEMMHDNADSWAVFGYRCLYDKFPVARGPRDKKADPKSVVWNK
ncbi:hypothetical protein CVT24_013266 [Panaeolus cyanescens]|uniref:Lysine-specific metallo-endopeptidase domain-containing protein n=1 Tax=Panaeolus cyanescens TaxID=181874 RepID=A0A409YN16_9AGAR|nr:hypothetical protein CVT24_013266 [Panaeolus cyanescens]